MSKVLTLLFLLGQSSIYFGQLFTLRGTCQITRSYCGGVAPSPEVYAQHIAPQPYIGKILYLKKGLKNSLKQKTIAQAVCDSNGYFSFTVTPGDYCIVQEEHTRSYRSIIQECKSSYLQINADCIKQWWINGLQSLSIKTHTTLKPLEFHQACFTPGDIPCIGYTGPMPP